MVCWGVFNGLRVNAGWCLTFGFCLFHEQTEVSEGKEVPVVWHADA